ncbi:MAG TPA: hypothetical protein VEA99_10285 [Gemmatimonadaceae bacterium]|nr:hypothetical protein [Gemmatimonadaceae bacterium]
MRPAPRQLSIAALLIAAPAAAQHEGHATHVDSAAAVVWHLDATPLVTRATPTAGRRSLTEGYLAHPVAMVQASTPRGGLALHAMLNLEGLTLRRGELSTGVFGEGYVDRRHPHAYLHELVLSSIARVGPATLSLAAGRGFAPFGSDDPLVRPLVKFPVNHHHAQILERVLVVGAARVGPFVGEVGTFNGDEPTSPGSEPRWSRFGDSWSTRLTWRLDGTLRERVGDLEMSGSYASVRSPEDPDRIVGFDQRKWHAAARLERTTPLGTGYLLTEWAHTGEYDTGRRFIAYESLLGEAALCGRAGVAALRLERSERHEAIRLEDLFRYPVPHDDVQIIGVTRWSVATARLGTPAWVAGILRASPFVEASLARPEDRLRGAAFTARGFFGSRSLWMVSVGARLAAGGSHGRMGRYGVAASSSHAHASTSGC